MRVLYYNPVINEPVGAGSHGRGLATALVREGHDLMTVPAVLAQGESRRESAGRFGRVPEFVKIPARDVRGRMRAARSSAAVLDSVAQFAPELAVVRRVPYDYTLPRVVRSITCPVVAECNGLAASETAAYYGQSTLVWESNAEQKFYRNADACVAITDEVRDELVGIGVPADRVSVVHNGVDVELFSPNGDVDPDVARWRTGFDVVVGYCAKVSPLHDLGTVASSMRSLIDARSDVGFLFVGPTEEQLIEVGLEPGLFDSRCLATGLVPHEDVPSILRGADIAWSALSNRHGSPLKLFEHMALGHPVVVAAEGSGLKPITDAGAGEVVGRGDAAALSRAVVRRLDDAALRAREGTRAIDWIQQYGQWSAVARRVMTLGGRLRDR